MELGSRPLLSLCARIQAILFQVCLTTEDLMALGVWSEVPASTGLSPAVASRLRLHRSARVDPALLERVTDLLDLRFLNSLSMLRSLTPEELEGVVRHWLAEPNGEALPGLLWSLCTDPRDEAARLGAKLGAEAQTLAWEAFRSGSGTRVR